MRRGAALPVVLFTLALTSGLAVGGAFVTRRLVASAGELHRAGDLEAATEGALVEVLALWDSTARAGQAIGSTAALATVERSGAVTEAWVTRASSTTYWIVTEATSAVRPVLRRRLGLSVQVIRGKPRPVPVRAWSELP